MWVFEMYLLFDSDHVDQLEKRIAGPSLDSSALSTSQTAETDLMAARKTFAQKVTI